MGLNTAASLVAAFNFSSAVGRILAGVLSDRFGAVNTLLSALTINALTIIVVWPLSTSEASLIALVILSGLSSGAFASSMPTTVGNVFGSQRVSSAMGFVVTGWVGGFTMVSEIYNILVQNLSTNIE